MTGKFSPKTTKVVFFDMNNTLIDAKSSFAACFVSVLIDFTGRWEPGEGEERGSPEQVLNTYLSAWEAKTAALKKKPQAAAEARRACLRQALAPYPFPVNDVFVRSFFREMRNQARDHASPFPDAVETVRALADAYRLGIITNGGKERQLQVLRKTGLAPYIEDRFVFSSASVGSRKPHPAIFRQALQQMQTTAAESVMVGDSWKQDIAGALACGMKAVWLDRSGAGEHKKRYRQADGRTVPVVHSLARLRPLFM